MIAAQLKNCACHAAKTAVAAILTWLVAAVSVAGAAITVPIEGKLVPERVKATVGETLTFNFELALQKQFPGVSVHISLPTGVTLVDGAADVDLVDLVPGTRRTFVYRLRVDDPGEKKVEVEARILGIAPAVMQRGFYSVINPASATGEQPTIRRDPDGKTYQTQGISSKKSP